jgi:hypothetical protein
MLTTEWSYFINTRMLGSFRHCRGNYRTEKISRLVRDDAAERIHSNRAPV